MRVAAIIVILGWGSAQSAATEQTLSFADARKAVVGERSQLWKDPESIRTASISAPQPCPFLPDDTCVRVETNIQNMSGGGEEQDPGIFFGQQNCRRDRTTQRCRGVSMRQLLAIPRA